MNAAWTQHLKENPQYKGRTGARAGFLLGWLEVVRATVEELGVTDDERIGTDLALNNHYGRGLAKGKTNKIPVFGSALRAGGEAGQSFKLHRPISAGQLKIGAR